VIQGVVRIKKNSVESDELFSADLQDRFAEIGQIIRLSAADKMTIHND
jgi:hypothetical protein